ncbi:hypothetical protein KUTeg_019676 [Tegillarca granosa]|uniref:Protein unc-93 homolog A n=1 Tax=Tegillarca granosa TaxID=220873 RepID=A0ABQ9EIE5_TEGGR|nr:hypothetical protein KUTeg_019676 [Tegillarca granosa]
MGEKKDHPNGLDMDVGTTFTSPMSKFRILKNLFVTSFGFLLLFTSFQSLSNLQSTLNKAEGLGLWGLTTIYIALVLSCFFLPPFVISHLGCKWTLAFSMVCYIAYMAANLYAVFALMIPAAAILGIGAAPLWSAKCTYLTQTAVWYAKMTGTTSDDVINRFFGFFFLMFQTSQIWGNLISSLVFSPKTQNSTVDVSPEALAKCGPNFDPTVHDVNNTNLNRPEEDKVRMVCYIYIAFAASAVIIVAVFLDKIKLDKTENTKENKGLSLHLFLETFWHFWRNPYQKFILSYISCGIGIWNIGFVMITYGVVDAICSITFGRLVQFVGHIPFFALAFFVHGGTQIALLLWIPKPEPVIIYYIFAALWGIGDAVIQTQINALYGYLFTEDSEAAFANYRLWESLGFIFSFAVGNFIRTDVKLYICLFVLFNGMFGYVVVEYLKNSEIKRNKKDKGLSTRL